MTSFCTWQTRAVLENNRDILFLLPVRWCNCNAEWINTNSAFCEKHHNLEKDFAIQTVARNNNLLYLADEQILTFPCKLVFSLLVIFPAHLPISYQQKQMPGISCWKRGLLNAKANRATEAAAVTNFSNYARIDPLSTEVMENNDTGGGFVPASGLVLTSILTG